MGGQVAFCRSHLVDPSPHKFPQAHEGVGGVGGRVIVIQRPGVFFGPVLEEHVPSPGSQRLVGLSHEIWRGDVRLRWGEGVHDERKMCEAFL